jgi:2-phosphosulfolactate phosphatase
MINISLHFTHDELESALDIKDKNVVVIDILRTSTTMLQGLYNGAKEIIPTEDAASAGTIGRNSMGQSLLCGERYGKIIEGFNLGNSVKEYNKETVSGKNLIFCSTNGTPALMKCKFTKSCAILGFSNMSRVVQYLIDLNEDFIILCAGRSGEFSLEDTVCAGMVITKLMKKNTKDKYSLTDSALGSTKLYQAYKDDLEAMMHETEHGRYLIELGFEDDLNECARVDNCPCLALLRNGTIKLIESFESDPKLTMKKVNQKTSNSK